MHLVAAHPHYVYPRPGRQAVLRLPFALAALAWAAATAGTAGASFPALTDLVDQCALAVSGGGSCVPYPADGVCAAALPVNSSVYIPSTTSLSEIEAELERDVIAAINNAPILGQQCLENSVDILCVRAYFPCKDSGDPSEPLPILPCASACADYWQVCSASLALYWRQVLNNDYKASAVVNCALGGTFNSSWGATPQSPDVWGGRAIPNMLSPIRGLLGVSIFPVENYNYTFANGTVVQLSCYVPNTTFVEANFVPPAAKCGAPLSLSADGSCAISCPFPIFPESVSAQVGWAFAVPGILGFAICLLTLVDSCMSILNVPSTMLVKIYLNRLFVSSSAKDGGATSKQVSTSAHKTPMHSRNSVIGALLPRRITFKLTDSTVFVFIGSCLGLVYFAVGPLQTLLFGDRVSCSAPEITATQLSNPLNLPGEPAPCVLQRISPFVLQAEFNAILFSIASTFLGIRRRQQSFKTDSIRRWRWALLLYSVSLPVLTLVIAASLDHISADSFTAAIQLARQAQVCQFRLSQVAEWFLVFGPFILSGALVSVLAVAVVLQLRDVERKLDGLAGRTRTVVDSALTRLIFRLSLLGLATFALLIVVISTTAWYSRSLALFSPPFVTMLNCIVQFPGDMGCVNCNIYRNLSSSLEPKSYNLALQLASESLIVCLFGLFALSETIARIVREWRETKISDITRRLKSLPYGASEAANSMVFIQRKKDQAFQSIAGDDLDKELRDVEVIHDDGHDVSVLSREHIDIVESDVVAALLWSSALVEKFQHFPAFGIVGYSPKLFWSIVFLGNPLLVGVVLTSFSQLSYIALLCPFLFLMTSIPFVCFLSKKVLQTLLKTSWLRWRIFSHLVSNIALALVLQDIRVMVVLNLAIFQQIVFAGDALLVTMQMRRIQFTLVALCNAMLVCGLIVFNQVASPNPLAVVLSGTFDYNIAQLARDIHATQCILLCFELGALWRGAHQRRFLHVGAPVSFTIKPFDYKDQQRVVEQGFMSRRFMANASVIGVDQSGYFVRQNSAPMGQLPEGGGDVVRIFVNQVGMRQADSLIVHVIGFKRGQVVFNWIDGLPGAIVQFVMYGVAWMVLIFGFIGIKNETLPDTFALIVLIPFFGVLIINGSTLSLDLVKLLVRRRTFVISVFFLALWFGVFSSVCRDGRIAFALFLLECSVFDLLSDARLVSRSNNMHMFVWWEKLNFVAFFVALSAMMIQGTIQSRHYYVIFRPDLLPPGPVNSDAPYVVDQFQSLVDLQLAFIVEKLIVLVEVSRKFKLDQCEYVTSPVIPRYLSDEGEVSHMQSPVRVADNLSAQGLEDTEGEEKQAE